MWILFGTDHNTAPFVYFIGVFDNVKKANKERIRIAANSKECYPDDFFIKKVEMNLAHTYDFSWDDYGKININNYFTLEDVKRQVLNRLPKICK
jgi:hypothetical protein